MEITKTTAWKVVKLPDGKYTLRRQRKVTTVTDEWWPNYVDTGATWQSRTHKALQVLKRVREILRPTPPNVSSGPDA